MNSDNHSYCPMLEVLWEASRSHKTCSIITRLIRLLGEDGRGDGLRLMDLMDHVNLGCQDLWHVFTHFQSRF